MPGPRLLLTTLAAVLVLAPGGAGAAAPVAVRSPKNESAPAADSAKDAASPPAPDTGTHPLAKPVVRADAVFTADRATVWRDAAGDRWIELRRDVRFKLGAYGFRGRAAVVRVHTQRAPGRATRRLAIVVDRARPLPGAGAAVSASADRLLVTAATSGALRVKTNLFTPAHQPPGNALTRDARARIARHDRRMRHATFDETLSPIYGPKALARRRDRRAQIRRAQRPLAATPTSGAPRRKSAAAIASAVAQPGVLPTSGVVRFSADRIVFQPGKHQDALMLIGGVRVLYQSTPAPGSSSSGSSAPGDSGGSASGGGIPARERKRGNALAGSGSESAQRASGIERALGGGSGARSVTLQAQRAVLLLDPRATRGKGGGFPGSGGGADSGGSGAGGGALPTGVVRGVYLEDNAIATAGGFTVRAPRVFYDPRQNRAVLLRAVLYTYDVKRQLPLYLRARKFAQTSARSFEARGAMLTTSEFAQPLLSIRADKVTFDQTPAHGGGQATNAFTARGTTLNARGVPFFYWPYLAGHGRSVPLRRVRVGYDSHGGPEVQTRWDLFALAGHDAPDGVGLTGDIDYRGQRGPGLGADLHYDTESARGRARAYFLPDDQGTDRIGDRDDVGHDGDARGYIHAQHRQSLPSGFELSGELGYASDPTFLEEFFPDQAYEQKPYETSLYLKKQRDDWAFTALAKTNINNFLAQPDRLESPGFVVGKAPQLGYRRNAASLWGDRLSWYSQTTFGRLRAYFGGDRPADRGFTQAQSQALFGINKNTSFDRAADAIGFPNGWVNRLDSRQEISAPLALGPVSVTPYAVGRVTAYDTDFSRFNGGEDDQVRLWGGVGARVRTEFSRGYGHVGSSLLDLHRLRHIIEPHADLFLAGSTLDSRGDLPPYDFGVESLARGGGLRLGLTQTFQTQRGGPGQWHSVDWIKLTTDAVLRTHDQNARDRAPIARFFDYRPEYTIGGDHFYAQLSWMVSDTLGVSGELNQSFDTGDVARWSLGATLRHTPRLTSFIRYNVIHALDSRLLSYGLVYQLTTKYRLRFTQRFDFDHGGSRSLDVALERELAHWRLRLLASWDQIDNEQRLGITFTPKGLGGNSQPLDLLE